eukprot:gene11014-19857_t
MTKNFDSLPAYARGRYLEKTGVVGTLDPYTIDGEWWWSCYQLKNQLDTIIAEEDTVATESRGIDVEAGSSVMAMEISEDHCPIYDIPRSVKYVVVWDSSSDGYGILTTSRSGKRGNEKSAAVVFDLKDTLKYQYKANFLKWLIDLGKANSSTAIPTKLRKPGDRSATNIVPVLTILLLKKDGYCEGFGKLVDTEGDHLHDLATTSIGARPTEERAEMFTVTKAVTNKSMVQIWPEIDVSSNFFEEVINIDQAMPENVCSTPKKD